MAKDVQIGSISELANKMQLYKEAEGAAPITFLIGAGCSVTAGIPAVDEIAQNLVRDQAHRFTGKRHKDASKALDVLFGKGWLPGIAQATQSGQEPNWGSVYDGLFKEVFSSPDDVRDIFKKIIKTSDPKINWAHLALGELAAENWLGTTITTNFDLLALEGYARSGVFPVVSDGLESLDRIDPKPEHPQLIQINGSIHSYRLRNDEADLDDVQASNAAITCFRSLFQSSRVFVVVGYAGREPQIMHLLKGAAEAYPDKHVFWCLYSDDPDDLSENARDFLGHSKNARLLVGQAADNFFLELSKRLDVHAPLAFRDPLKYHRQQLDRVFDAENLSGLDRVAGEIQALRDRLDLLEACENAPQPEPEQPPDPQPEASKTRLIPDKAGREAAQIVSKLKKQSSNSQILFDEVRNAQDEWYEIGREKGDAEASAISIALAKYMLELAQTPNQRGSAWNNLGNALQTLGARDSDSALLEQAVAAYTNALKECTRDHVPLDWAMIQNNLGAALQTLGERDSDSARLEQAITALTSALKERTRDRVPLEWARTRNNLGNALTTLGERDSDSARLEQAITALTSALEERTRDRVPLDWAMTQDNLGSALRILGERDGDSVRLEQAIAAFTEALKERTRDRVPLEWAETQFNLALAHRALFDKTTDAAHLEMALSLAQSALEVYQVAGAGHYIAEVQNGIDQINAALSAH